MAKPDYARTAQGSQASITGDGFPQGPEMITEYTSDGAVEARERPRPKEEGSRPSKETRREDRREESRTRGTEGRDPGEEM